MKPLLVNPFVRPAEDRLARRETIARALNRLSPAESLTMWVVFATGSLTAAAQVLGITHNAMRKRWERGMKKASKDA
jgi:DNA-directed RNA polymerase specialized sigma24 family protein